MLLELIGARRLPFRKQVTEFILSHDPPHLPHSEERDECEEQDQCHAYELSFPCGSRRVDCAKEGFPVPQTADGVFQDVKCDIEQCEQGGLMRSEEHTSEL